VWDSKGWQLLGAQTVHGRTDRDVITVGRYQGRFDELMMVVTDSDIELLDFDVVFANNERWSPRLGHYFREGSRTRKIDLPGDDRVIQRIELKYKNLPGGGRAKVEVWGRDTGRRPTTWDNKGWTQLGAATIDGARDRDVLRISNQNPWAELMLVATDNDVELWDITVTFGNGDKWSPPARMQFKAGAMVQKLNPPGKERRIQTIEFRYGNVRGGRAVMQVWGRPRN
jgi:hypothetical protein